MRLLQEKAFRGALLFFEKASLFSGKENKMPDYFYETRAHRNGFTIVCGTDEAGRGPLAGPVYAAAVILPEGLQIDGLDDSKKLSEKKRESLFSLICERAISYKIAWADAEEIDRLNILNASQLAMRRAVEGLSPSPDLVLVDGNVARGFASATETIVGGDAKSMSIAAASILAKVARDRFCAEMDALYPLYRFAKHKGYPTKEHRELLLRYGPCPLHRKSFLKFLTSEKPPDERLSQSPDADSDAGAAGEHMLAENPCYGKKRS